MELKGEIQEIEDKSAKTPDLKRVQVNNYWYSYFGDVEIKKGDQIVADYIEKEDNKELKTIKEIRIVQVDDEAAERATPEEPVEEPKKEEVQKPLVKQKDARTLSIIRQTAVKCACAAYTWDQDIIFDKQAKDIKTLAKELEDFILEI